MKRLQLLRFGNPDEVIALNEAPEPALKAGEVLVKLEAASINPSDFLREGLLRTSAGLSFQSRLRRSRPCGNGRP